MDQFDTNGNSDHIPAILFMSDGHHNTAPDPDAYVTECKNKGIPIFTVGFAKTESEVDEARLREIASNTDGEYHFVKDIFDLQNTFLKLQHKASGWEAIATYIGDVNQGETVTAGSFNVDPSVTNLRVTLNWPGSNLDLILFDPNGRQVDFNDPGIIYSGDAKPEFVIIKDPQPGTWTAKVYGKTIGSSEKYYVLVANYEPPIQPKKNQPPEVTSLLPAPPSPQPPATVIRWTATASDPDGDTIYYRFDLKGPSTGGAWKMMRDWSTSNTWEWAPTRPGDYDIDVWISDNSDPAYEGPTIGSRCYYTISETGQPHKMVTLTPNLPSPQSTNTKISWTATAEPSSDTALYKFSLKGPSTGYIWRTMRNWDTGKTWEWTPTRSGDYEIDVWVRESGMSASGEEGTGARGYFTII